LSIQLTPGKPAIKKEPMIVLKDLEKSIRSGLKKVWLLNQINLEIQEGEFVTIMGPSGAGKTTLLNILGMLETSSGGEYYFYDEAIHRLNERRRNEIHKEYMGFVFQAYHLIDDLTVYENIETPLLYRNVKSKDRKSIVADVLDRFNIVAKKDLFPDQLSGGQQQLVGVARAIIHKPRLLLADEPTGNLHSKQGEQIMDLFKELNDQGVTIVQVTHSEKNAEYGTRIIELVDGNIKEDKVLREVPKQIKV
jgi:ABC-type lipoprotein export system ATPase subunit